MSNQLDNYEVDELGCHLFAGKLDRDGYGVVWRGNHATRAYVAAWTQVHGPVADGLVLDHLCRRRACIALHHLEPVTKSENALRMRWAYRVRKRRCPRGHDMSINAIVTKEGGRVCRTCNHEAANACVEPGVE